MLLINNLYKLYAYNDGWSPKLTTRNFNDKVPLNFNLEVNMSHIVKVCKIHGPLTEDQVLFNDKYPRCHQCKIDKDRRWKNRNKEQHIATSKRWKKENREHYLEWQRQDREKDPEKYRKWSRELKSKNRKKIRKQEICRIHGLKLDQYEQMIIDQENKCYICGKEEQTRGRGGDIMPLCVDHCHKSEAEGNYKVRKLLCRMCNQGIGFFKDDIDLMKKIISYIEEHQ